MTTAPQAAPAQDLAGRPTRFPHRPALDGIRGVFMVIFMLFHLGVAAFQGAWVAVNVFFVLSGFLIVRLLVAEREASGRLRLLEFYRRRARRLLPALFLVLGAIVAYGMLLAPDDARRPMRGDVLATLGFVMNWRLILRDDQYFEQFGNPSYLRHAWTLAVEEQFYVLAPLLVLGLVALLARRRARVGVLLALAAVSAVWTAVVGIGSMSAQSHAYYGTDTRAQALLVGAALAFALVSRDRDPQRDERAAQADNIDPEPEVKTGESVDAAGSGEDQAPRRTSWAGLSPAVVTAVGWVSLVLLVAGTVVVAPFPSWVYDYGGMLVLSAVAAALVLVAADDRAPSLQRVLGAPPLAYLGKLSYGLYLWHWPITLWLGQAMPEAPTWQVVVVGLTLTFLLAKLSYDLVEQPVLRHGLRGLTGRLTSGRAITAGGLAVLVAGAVSVSSGLPPAPAQAATPVEQGSEEGNPTFDQRVPSYVPSVPDLVRGQRAYTRPDPPVRIGMVGDSVPFLLARNFPARNFPGTSVANLAVAGCDTLDLPVANPNGGTLNNTPECVRGKQRLTADLQRSGADVSLLFPSTLLAFSHQVDGAMRRWGDPAFERAVGQALDSWARRSRAGGVAGLMIATLPCRVDLSGLDPGFVNTVRTKEPEAYREARNPVQINAYLRGWAKDRGVPVLELGRAVCGDTQRSSAAGIQFFQDGLHFSVPASPMIWKWMLPQILAPLGSERRP